MILSLFFHIFRILVDILSLECFQKYLSLLFFISILYILRHFFFSWIYWNFFIFSIDKFKQTYYNSHCRKTKASFIYADVAELADAQDLKSCGTYLPCRFDSGHLHQKIKSSHQTITKKSTVKGWFFCCLYIVKGRMVWYD